MADYAVVFARSARKELQNLDPQVAWRIIKQIEALVTDPRPSGVVISDRDRLVDVVAVRHRSDVYR